MQADPQQQRIKEIKEAFDYFDKDNNGLIPARDLMNVFKYLGQDPNEEEINQYISELDPEQIGNLGFAECLQMLTKAIKDDDTYEELMESFRIFDKDATGLIPSNEMRYILMEMGDKMAANDVKDLIKEMDPDDSGMCKYADYVKKKYDDLQAIKAKAKGKKKKK